MKLSNAIIRIRNYYRRRLSIHCRRRSIDLRPKFPIISFTFDDFPQSSLQQGGAILKRHGVSGTYYVSLGLMGRELPAGPGFSIDDLRQVVANGHELGCHTFDHCHSWETNPDAFENSIIENKRRLADLIPDAIFKSLSYPISCPRPETKRRAAKYFDCCRGGGDSTNIGPSDMSNLQACFLEKHTGNPMLLQNLIRETCRTRGWLIFATHDVCESPTSLGCKPEFFENIVQTAVASGARVLPVGRAWEILQD